MKNKLKILFSICITLIVTINGNSQNSQEKTKEYFNQYLNSKEQFKLIARSLPTLEQCKIVFKDEYATEYFNFVSTLNEQIENNLQKLELEEHSDCKIDIINTSDLNNNSYNARMDEYAYVFKSEVTFYRVTYILKDGSESSRSTYKFFVNIDGNWLFFANPGIVFRK